MAAKRLLAVWAHPDDEAFGPVGTMRMAHDLGWETAVLTATRGDAGQDEGHLADRQPLGDVRETELRNACNVLGVDRVDVWRYPDGGLHDVPLAELTPRVLAVMQEWQPQIVITFGPDGITGHADHVAISAATQQAFHDLRSHRGSDGPQCLYYVTIKSDREIEHPMGEAPPPQPATAIIDVREYEQTKRDALACHASQRADWEPLLADRDWLTVDRLHRAYPPATADAPPETTIFDE